MRLSGWRHNKKAGTWIQPRLAGIVVLLLLVAVLVPAVGGAQGPNRAGLIIVSDEGVRTACVDFPEPSISGITLLERSGQELSYQAMGGNAAVCSIGGAGCAYPRQGCFCECQGGAECRYWTYWHLDVNGWQYASTGASSSEVKGGDVDAWVWSDSTTAMDLLPEMGFDAICRVPAEMESAAQGLPTVQTSPEAAVVDTMTSGVPQVDAAEPQSMPPQRTARSFALWGGAAVLLLVALIWAVRRR